MKIYLFLAPVLDLLVPLPENVVDTCKAHQCDTVNPDFVVGQVYTYDYEVNTVTQMKNSPDDSSSMAIKLRAQIQALTSCRFSLQVRPY